jgi:aminoglycoside phosphotransferase (APT) family kinase protein
VRTDWLGREPDIASREAAALRLLEGTDVSAPCLIAVDADGSASGVPSVLMTRLRGRVVLAPPDIDSWLRQMAAALPRIHAARPSGSEMPWTYRPYNDISSLQIPTLD